jgi:molybdenum cofactor cytidylyltransferase
MRFVMRKLANAEGAMLAQAIQAGPQRLRKGVVLTGLMRQWLQVAGYDEVAVAELAPGDLPENDAAHAIAAALCAPGLVVEPPVNGRCNIQAGAAGLFRADVQRLAELNLLDEAITFAALPDRHPVQAGQVVGTVKIIPMAVEALLLQKATAIAASVCRLAPYRARRCALILTRSPLRKASVLRKTEASMAGRVEARGGIALAPQICAHEPGALAEEIGKALALGADLIMIAGAAAVADREDVAPTAVMMAGGRIIRFGMPVFPGNLVCMCEVSDADVLILPGCAGAPRLNGADWILDRLFAGEKVTAEDIARMGAGGLIEAESGAAAAGGARDQREA